MAKYKNFSEELFFVAANETFTQDELNRFIFSKRNLCQKTPVL